MEEHSAILLHERYQFEKVTCCMIQPYHAVEQTKPRRQGEIRDSRD